MKKILKSLLYGLVIVSLFTGNVFALSFNDTTINWPGYTPGITTDEIGIPKISSIDVTIETIDNNDFLKSVVLHMTGRQAISYITGGWDALFINTGGNASWQHWNYYIEDTTWNNNNGATMWQVKNNYNYILAESHGYSVRLNHPAGINHNNLENETLADVNYNGDTLTYTFSDGIKLDDGWVIGYSLWCANDVILTPVPEPGIILLLGLGLAGIGIIRRKR